MGPSGQERLQPPPPPPGRLLNCLTSPRSQEIPENILQATATLKTVNIIPALGEFPTRLSVSGGLVSHSPVPFSPPGLNVHSLLKHEAVVLTLETLQFLEDKLLWHDQRYTPLYPFRLPYSDFP